MLGREYIYGGMHAQVKKLKLEIFPETPTNSPEYVII